MLFRTSDLAAIRDGTVTVAFRRWQSSPTVRAGGTLLTPVGVLPIATVTPVGEDSITDADARRAGYAAREPLLDALGRRGDGQVFRVEWGAVRPDPRVALRQQPATGPDLDALQEALRRLDARAADGPWTTRVLAIIRDHPGVRAGDLCALVGQQKARFKRNVRTLKGHGLTESLGMGYRLSPRGAALLATTPPDGAPPL